MRRVGPVLLALGLAVACSGGDDATPGGGSGGHVGADAGGDADAPDFGNDSAPSDAPDSADADADTAAPAPCPSDMVLAEGFCIDRYEAPNVAGALPLVMYDFVEAEAWCSARAKRLCFDDEWTTSCEGPNGWSYPYGDTHVPGTCNDDKTWLLYDQQKLNGWPWTVSTPPIETLAELLDAARAVSASGKVAADHVEELYQGDPSGSNAGCVGPAGVLDLEGNVEEWTRRRDGGDGPDFSGALKGRYWAEPRTCQNAVTTHGNGFRFYEIGFRCCRDADPVAPLAD
jgi:formylglycine-generating enzyme required for sulfatase activity